MISRRRTQVRVTPQDMERNDDVAERSVELQTTYWSAPRWLQFLTHLSRSVLLSGAGDPLPHVINSLMKDGKIICFDEFQVTDVADALILRRLFTGLYDQGCVFVFTSNRKPDDLYLGGLQRDLFVPFIDVLKTRNEIVDMWESDVDYRLVFGQYMAEVRTTRSEATSWERDAAANSNHNF